MLVALVPALAARGRRAFWGGSGEAGACPLVSAAVALALGGNVVSLSVGAHRVG